MEFWIAFGADTVSYMCSNDQQRYCEDQKNKNSQERFYFDTHELHIPTKYHYMPDNKLSEDLVWEEQSSFNDKTSFIIISVLN